MEIGPGSGAITRRLLDAGQRVVAVEIDPALAQGLRELGPRLEVITGSILDFAPGDLAPPPVRIVGALPYHKSGAILRWLADEADDVLSAGLILQEEVVERMGAPPGDRARGVLSVVMQSVYEVRPLFRISPGAFSPRPKVWSRVVCLRRLEGRPVAACTATWEAARVVFHQRRRMVRSIIARIGGQSLCEHLASVGLDLTLRAEDLSLADLETLANALVRVR